MDNLIREFEDFMSKIDDMTSDIAKELNCEKKDLAKMGEDELLEKLSNSKYGYLLNRPTISNGAEVIIDATDTEIRCRAKGTEIDILNLYIMGITSFLNENYEGEEKFSMLNDLFKKIKGGLENE